MKKSIKVTPKKKRGRPATGRDPHVTSRMPTKLIAEVASWAAANDTTRSEAIRRLVELGLAVKTRSAPSDRQRAEIADLASKTIDSLTAETTDSLTAETTDNNEKANRKRRLIKGPEEFREVRVDRPNAKK
jgi:Winged helix DNA-binding domain